MINIGEAGQPFVVKYNSSVSMVCAANGWHADHIFEQVVVETRAGGEKVLHKDALPKRILMTGERNNFVEQYFVPWGIGEGAGFLMDVK